MIINLWLPNSVITFFYCYLTYTEWPIITPIVPSLQLYKRPLIMWYNACEWSFSRTMFYNSLASIYIKPKKKIKSLFAWYEFLAIILYKSIPFNLHFSPIPFESILYKCHLIPIEFKARPAGAVWTMSLRSLNSIFCYIEHKSYFRKIF